MIRKAVVLSIFFLIVVGMYLPSRPPADALNVSTVEAEVTEIVDIDEKEYDEKLYGRFFLALPPVINNYTENPLSLQRGEEREFTLTFEYKREMHLRRAEVEEIDPIQDFKMRFLIAKEKWMPSLESVKPRIGGPSAPDDPVDFGILVEDQSKMQDYWLEEMVDKTENVYELEPEVLDFDSNTDIVEMDMTLSIEQGGDWHLVSFFKPEGGNYWVLPHNGYSSVRGSDNIIHVERPKGFHNSLPIIATGFIAGVFVYGAVEAKKRS